MAKITMSRRLDMPYSEVVERVKSGLREVGFGVLTEVDIKATLQEKLGEDFRDYVIIGACNPPLAHRALQADLRVGVLLPCNVVVYADGDGSIVDVFDPEVGMSVAGAPALEPVAREARDRLARMLEQL